MSEPDGYQFGRYDFGLDTDAEARAARLHRDSIVIDLLYWGPVTHRSFDGAMEQRLRNQFDGHRNPATSVYDAYYLPGRMAVEAKLPQLREAWAASGLTGGSYPFHVGSAASLAVSAGYLQRMVDGLGWVRKVRTAEDFVAAKREGQLAWVGLCQPTEPVSKDISMLDRAYDFGLRALMLTYNQQDFVGAGCTERTDAGLTDFGRRVVAHCNALGIAVDTAHCGRRTTLDACEASQAPVMASHTAAAAVYDHDRGKSDEELLAIAATGGVIGVVTVPFFLGPVADATVETWLDHVDHIANLVGSEHVAIGTDWPMAGPKWTMQRLADAAHELGFRDDEHGTGDITSNLIGFDDYRDMPNFTRGLVARGYDDEQITGILGGNALRVFSKTIG
jgi:membrane dipeptidase